MAYWFLVGVVTVAIVVFSLLLGGWFFLLLFVPLVAILSAILVRGGASPTVSRRARQDKPELLGPSGPDDPGVRR